MTKFGCNNRGPGFPMSLNLKNAFITKIFIMAEKTLLLKPNFCFWPFLGVFLNFLDLTALVFWVIWLKSLLWVRYQGYKWLYEDDQASSGQKVHKGNFKHAILSQKVPKTEIWLKKEGFLAIMKIFVINAFFRLSDIRKPGPPLF